MPLSPGSGDPGEQPAWKRHLGRGSDAARAEVYHGALEASFAPRLKRLRQELEGLDHLVIAFSGGVDSSVLLHAALQALPGRVLAVVADSPSLPRAELAQARQLAALLGAELEVVETQELELASYRANRGDRCYFCKRTLYAAMEQAARARGWTTLAFGEITDDLLDVRPGARAAAERGVLAPLSAAGFSKADVRAYARHFALPVADKPASACLASRIPVGTEVTRAALERIEAAEARVRALGFRVLRVRDHGERARVEVGDAERADSERLRPQLAAALEPLGFKQLELAVYRSPAATASVAGSEARLPAGSEPGS